MKLLFVTHAEFEKPGYFADWAKQNEHSTEEVRHYAGEKLPEVSTFDFLVMMGGPQSPFTIEKEPYLHNEINLIKQAMDKDKTVIGVCLGAQLIGEAMGAKTERSPHREVGAYPIKLLDSAKSDPIFQNFPDQFNSMHWHRDMPGINGNATLLAASEGCPRQIIRYGQRIYGFQCHFELTKELVKSMVENCRDDLNTGKYIHTVDQLMMIDYAEINAKLDFILNVMTKL